MNDNKMGEHYLSNSFKHVLIHQGVIELLSLLEFPGNFQGQDEKQEE